MESSPWPFLDKNPVLASLVYRYCDLAIQGRRLTECVSATQCRCYWHLILKLRSTLVSQSTRKFMKKYSGLYRRCKHQASLKFLLQIADKHGVIYQKTTTFIHKPVLTWSNCKEDPHIWLENRTYVVCLKSSVNGTRKQTKQKIQTN
jgi:hypothetical protein